MQSNTSASDPFWQELAVSSPLAGHPLILRDETGSTNSDALELGRAGAATGTIVIARSQTGGRGRLGRSWFSPAGCGLYFSMILRPALAPAELPRITLAAGVALCRAVSGLCRTTPLIKWPNDLLLGGRKCGGILTECEFGSDGSPLVVLGIGINVSTPSAAFPAELRGKVTCLADRCVSPIRRLDLLREIIIAVDAVTVRLEAGEFAALLAEWRDLDATREKRLTWVTTGGAAVTGISLGPDQEGLLHIRDDQGRTHAVLSGDILLQW